MKQAAFCLFRCNGRTPRNNVLLLRASFSSKVNEQRTGDQRLSEQIADIEDRVKRYKGQLRRHVQSSFKFREINSNIAALNLTMADAHRKKAVAATANTVANIPSHVSIEVVSNGTTHLAPCVAIKTPLKTYLFNCPEGTSRFLPALRLKSSNVYDIFVTRGVWQNIAGISSILLAKESNSMPVRLHGAMNVKHFLECIRPFQDSDFGSVKYPSSVEECTLATHDTYEDAGIKVHYIPLIQDPGLIRKDRPERKNTTDVAYLLELKEPARRIDPLKIMSMKVPKGPLIGKLKAGEAITLPDGKTIRPEDVFSDSPGANERRRALIVDCADGGYARSLIENSLVAKYSGSSATQKLDYVVHFSPDEVLDMPEYSSWADSLGENCTHIIVNGGTRAPVVPAIDSMFRHTRLLHKLQPALYDELRPQGWRGVVTQERDLEKRDGRWSGAAPLQRWWMRMAGGEEPIVIDLKEGVELNDKEQLQNNIWMEEMKDHVEKMTQAAQSCLPSLSSSISPSSSESFPRVTFLGTSSAMPSKYRNVSGYLFETGAKSAFLVDVGEGTYGQLRTILDEEGVEEMLLHLHAVFITHAHQDHMNGLYTVIEKRRDAFEKRGVAYRPLVLLCNRNVMKPLKTYTHCFEDLQRYVQVVDVSTSNEVRYAPAPKRPRSASGSESGDAELIPQTLAPTTSDLIKKVPAELYDRDEWQLDGALAVQVHHTRMANGFVFTTANEKKVVFSGDTKPCQLLVEYGKGADLLVHEATFEDGHEVDAERKKHSTMKQAVDIGTKMQAKNIILTHFSARYPKVPPLPSYLDASSIGIAMDGLRVPFDRLHLVPLLTPIYRSIFKDELFEIDLKKSQRELRAKEEQEKKNGEEPVKNERRGKSRQMKAYRPDL